LLSKENGGQFSATRNSACGGFPKTILVFWRKVMIREVFEKDVWEMVRNIYFEQLRAQNPNLTYRLTIDWNGKLDIVTMATSDVNNLCSCCWEPECYYRRTVLLEVPGCSLGFEDMYPGTGDCYHWNDAEKCWYADGLPIHRDEIYWEIIGEFLDYDLISEIVLEANILMGNNAEI
jgi:hypothetical protein